MQLCWVALLNQARDGKKLNELATGEKKTESQGELSADAIEEVPKNFGKQVIASVVSKIGDQLSKPGLDADSARCSVHGNWNARPR